MKGVSRFGSSKGILLLLEIFVKYACFGKGSGSYITQIEF